MKKSMLFIAGLFILVAQGASLAALTPEFSVVGKDNKTYDVYKRCDVCKEFDKETRKADICGRLAIGSYLAASWASFFVGVGEESFRGMGKALLRFYPKYAAVFAGLVTAGNYYDHKAKEAYEYQQPRMSVETAMIEKIGSEDKIWAYFVKERAVTAEPKCHHESSLL